VRAEFEGRALAGRPPVLLVRAVGKINKRHAQWRAGAGHAERRALGGGGDGRRAQNRRERGLKDGQRQAHAHATQKIPPREG